MIDIEICHKMINLEKAWKYSLGSGILVAILDRKIEDSQSAMLINSIAPQAKFFPVEGVDRGFYNQIEVINQIHRSIDSGCAVFCCSQSFRDLECMEEWEEVIAKAVTNGMVIISHTGNDNRRHINFPAGIEGVIAVGSADEVGQRFIWNSQCGSNYGTKIDCIVPAHSQARGLFRNWGHVDPGAIACANMVGVVALLKSVKKGLSFQDVQDLIKAYSNYSVIGWSQDMGYGVPDVFRMLASISPSEVDTEKVLGRLRLIGLEIESIMSELEG